MTHICVTRPQWVKYAKMCCRDQATSHSRRNLSDISLLTQAVMIHINGLGLPTNYRSQAEALWSCWYMWWIHRNHKCYRYQTVVSVATIKATQGSASLSYWWKPFKMWQRNFQTKIVQVLPKRLVTASYVVVSLGYVIRLPVNLRYPCREYLVIRIVKPCKRSHDHNLNHPTA